MLFEAIDSFLITSYNHNIIHIDNEIDMLIRRWMLKEHNVICIALEHTKLLYDLAKSTKPFPVGLF